MLKSLTCDQESFKTVRFRDGLNLVIADRTATSAQKGTRNGSGKTTLLELVHFCLGSAKPTGKATLAHPAVARWKFSLEFTAAGRTLTATRSVGNDDLIITGDTDGLPLNEDGVIERESWTEVLGSLMFGVTPEDRTNKKAPSFRQLIRYFARLGPDAMVNAFETIRKQSIHEVRYLNAFLLRLNWQLALRMKDAAEQHAQIAEAKRAVEAGAFDAEEATLAKLHAEETELEAEIEQATRELQSFRVHRQYGEIEQDANRLTAEIQDLSQLNYGDRQLLMHYEQQRQAEEVPDINLLLQLYRDAGVELGDNIAVTLEQAKEFHRSIVADRRQFLDGERRRLEREIATRERNIERMTDQRATLLDILRTHGALSEYEKLVSRVDTLRERLAVVSRRRSLQMDLDQKRLRLNVVLAELRLLTQQEVTDQSKYITSLQKTFGAYSKRLYGVWQHFLEIEAGKGGYDFKIGAVDRDASEGITRAGIFCYDATLATIWARQQFHPGFLIHDSSLFDPVEERQIEQALLSMAEETTPFQYICTLNTDRLPAQFAKDPAIILRLTDRGKTGGLLGIRF